MEQSIFKAFVALVLLTLPITRQDKIMVCKNIDNVFADSIDERNESTGAAVNRIQGPPGKKGVPGSRGLPGAPGVPGLPGTPATVDYGRISRIIEEQIRRGLEDVRYKVEILQNNVTELSKTPRQLCETRGGLFYELKCYFVPYQKVFSPVNYDKAVKICNSEAAAIADIHSRNHQQALEIFFRKKIPSTKKWIQIWVGMIYQSSKKNLQFRTGKEVSIDQFNWYRNHPYGSNEKILFQIKVDVQDPYQGLYIPNQADADWVLCEL